MTTRTGEVSSAGVDGEFSKVISETGKVSQTIDIKEEHSLSKSETTNPEDPGLQADPGDLTLPESAESLAPGYPQAVAQSLESGQETSSSDTAMASTQTDGQARESQLAHPSAAAAFRTDGRILPDAAGASGAVAPDPAAGQTSRGAGSADHGASAYLQPAVRSAERSEVSATGSLSDAVRGSTNREAISAVDGSLPSSSAERQTPPAAAMQQTTGAMLKPGTGKAPADPSAGNGRVVNGPGSAVETAGDALRQPSAGPAESKAVSREDHAGVQRPAADPLSAAVRSPLSRHAATTDASTVQASVTVTAQQPSGGIAKVPADRQPLSEAADQSSFTAPTRSSLAARLRQLNATHQTAVDTAIQTVTNPTAKLDQISSPTLPGYVGAAVSAAQKPDAGGQSLRPGVRERALGAELQLGERAPGVNSTAAGGELVRAESAVLRGEASAALAQLPAQLARQVLHSHAQSVSELRLQLKPEELGSLDLKLRVDGDRVHVAMLTAQPGVKDLLEAQLPQLRALLEQGGLQLGDVDVAERGADGDANSSEAQVAGQGSRPSEDSDSADQRVETASRRPQGLIDAFV